MKSQVYQFKPSSSKNRYCEGKKLQLPSRVIKIKLKKRRNKLNRITIAVL